MKKNYITDWIFYILPPAFLGCWGALLFHIYHQNLLPLLQHPRFHILTICSAFILVCMAILYILISEAPISLLTTRPRNLILQLLVLFVPILLYFLVPISGYSPQSLLNRTETSQQTFSFQTIDTENIPDWIKKPNLTMPVKLSEIFMASYYTPFREKMEGIPISVIGQWLPSPKANHFKIVRFFMFCCASDAQPVELQIQGQAPSIPNSSWVNVIGKIHFENDQDEPILVADQIKPCDKPDEIFLY
jgi:uncharacterized repeat protein (TIGR03943 family)